MMTNNTNTEFTELGRGLNWLFLAGSVLMVIGMGMYVFMIGMGQWRIVAAGIYMVGALIFGCLQCMQTYKGTDFTLHRLKSIQNLSDLMFVLTGVLMFDTATQFMMPMFSNVETYLEFIYNKWLILLLVGVVLEVYTTHRISYILNKKNK